MILSDFDLKHVIKSRDLIIEPLKDDTIQQNGVDLRINSEYAMGVLEKNGEVIDSTSSEEIKRFYKTMKSRKGCFTLTPLRHYLLSTQERIKLPLDLMGFCGLRSTFARLGFVSPLTIVDAGFEGNLTIGVFYGGNAPIRIPVGCRFLHLVFARLTTKVDIPYRGNYQNQMGVRLPNALT